MRIFRINIECDNAAFGPEYSDEGTEVARILRRLADECEAGTPYDKVLKDYNGNTIGNAGIIER